MLSLDRYATVKHPRLAQLRQRQFLPSVLASVSFAGAGIISIPFLLVYKVATSSEPPTRAPPPSMKHQLMPTAAAALQQQIVDDNLISSSSNGCISDYASDEWHIVFIVSYVAFVFIVPIFGVIFNHIGE